MNNSRPKTILLVEDEAIISIVINKTLKRFGYEVISAGSGERALELVKSNEDISLILMDIELGIGIDGTVTAQKILAMRNIPIVFHTSHSERDMVERVKGITRYGYVIKSSGDFVLQSSIEMAFELFDANRNIEMTMNAMRESEEKYRAAFMTSPDAVNINAMDGRYVDINEGFTKLTGFTREDVIGVLSSEIDIWARPEDRVILVKGLTETGIVENLESVFRSKDGTLTTALMSARIIGLQNEPHILSITREITQRKKYEDEIKLKNEELGALNEEHVAAIEELEATNEEFEAINEELIAANQELVYKEEALKIEQQFTNSMIDSYPGIFYLYTYPELRLKRWNKNYEDVIGINSGEIKERHLLDWFPSDIRESVIETVEVVMKNGSATRETNLLTGDNKIIPFLLTGIKFESSGRTYLMGSGINITDRKKIENALTESEERYRTLARILPDGVVIHTEGRIVYANEAAHRIIHAEYPGQMIGYPVIEFVHPDYRTLASVRIQSGISERKTGEPVEEIFMALDGKNIIVSVTAIPFTFSGKPAMLTVFNDITDRKNSEEKIKNLLKEKELLLKEVHHRIKNNMNTIKGLLILQSYSLKDSSAQIVLKDAESRVESMMVLYDKLYRSDDFRELSLKEYLPALVDGIASGFLVHETIKVEKQIEDFNVDAKILFPIGIIVNELMTNSMKYAFSGRSSGLITVSAIMKEGRAVVVIADDGIGIPEFVDVDNSTGFGLGLVSMLAEQIGGRIHIERGKGTRFVLEFDV